MAHGRPKTPLLPRDGERVFYLVPRARRAKKRWGQKQRQVNEVKNVPEIPEILDTEILMFPDSFLCLTYNLLSSIICLTLKDIKGYYENCY